MNGLTLTQAARTISDAVGYRLSPSTIRSWCDAPQFQPFLTDDATPEPGTTRRLQQHDIDVMLRIAAYRQRNLSFDAIAEELTRPAEEPAPTAADAPLTPTDAPHAPHAPQAPDAMLEVVRILGDVQTAKLSSIDERLSHLESRQHSTWLILAAFAVGVIVTVLAVMLAMNAF